MICTFQPPSGGCVLKLCIIFIKIFIKNQPPSGGCVLKLINLQGYIQVDLPAAFGRLCVETRLPAQSKKAADQPPSGGCVLKQRAAAQACQNLETSRLRAAVC